METLRTPEDVFKIIDRIKPGETVLIECSTNSTFPDLATLFFVRYARSRGLPVIIDDNFDALYPIYQHLKFLGKAGELEDVAVLKTGGRMEVGRVIGRVPFSGDLRVYISKYMKLTQSVLAEMKNAINIVLGLESAFAFINSVQEFYHFVITLQNAVGNRHRRAFYIVNRDLLQYLEYNPLPEFERIATTVAEAVQVPDGSILTFKKAADMELLGESFRLVPEVVP